MGEFIDVNLYVEKEEVSNENSKLLPQVVSCKLIYLARKIIIWENFSAMSMSHIRNKQTQVSNLQANLYPLKKWY